MTVLGTGSTRDRMDDGGSACRERAPTAYNLISIASLAALSAVAAPTNLHRGNLKLTALNGTHFGYFGNVANIEGEFGVAAGEDDKLVVEFIPTCSGPFNILTVNGDVANPDFPYLAGVLGAAATSQDIGPNSYNYFSLSGAVNALPPYVPAQNVSNTFEQHTNTTTGVETPIFYFEESNQTISLQWINTDLSQPATYIGAITENGYNSVFGVGDPAFFEAAFGGTTGIPVWLTISFEPLSEEA